MLVKDKIDAAIIEFLSSHETPLYTDCEMTISQIALTPKLRSHIFYAKSTGNLLIGFENIEQVLEKELYGLERMGQVSDRISRLLIVTNDGSDRFYRQLTFTEKNHGGRTLMIRLDIDSKEFGQVLGLKGKNVKSALVTHKDSVCNILRQLIADEK